MTTRGRSLVGLAVAAGLVLAACGTEVAANEVEVGECTNTDLTGSCSWPGAQWYQNYSLSVRGGGQALQYFVSGAYQDDQYTLPLDELKKYNFQSNFTFSPVDNLTVDAMGKGGMI